MKRVSPRSVGEWGAVAPQWLGIFGLVACFTVWLLTQQVEPAFLTSFGGLIVVGQGAEAIATIRRGPPTPPPVPDKTLEEQKAFRRLGGVLPKDGGR